MPPVVAEAAPRRSGALTAILAGAALVFGGLTYFLLVAPTYSATVKPPKQVVASAGSRVPIEVANNGALGGTFRETPTLDGKAIAEVSGDVAAGEIATIDIVLPDDLSVGEHKLEIDGVEFAFTALTPAEYKVGKLTIEPEVAKPKQEVTVTAKVKNIGEATGTYPGVLAAGGKEVAAAETEIAGGETVPVRVTFTPARKGACKVAIEESKATVMVVKPVRLPNGKVLKNALSGGSGKVLFKNGYSQDCMFCLTTAKKAKKASLVVYVRGKSSTTLSGLRDGSYWVFYSSGKDWNRYTNDFLTFPYRGRFDKPADFRTSSWTTSYIDWGAWTKWTTQHTQYTIFTLELNPKYKTKEWTPPVPEGQFPKF